MLTIDDLASLDSSIYGPTILKAPIARPPLRRKSRWVSEKAFGQSRLGSSQQKFNFEKIGSRYF